MPSPTRPDPAAPVAHPAPREAAAALLRKELATDDAALKALLALVADPRALGDLLAGMPGGALLALRLFAEQPSPLGASACTALLDGELGPERGRDALAALRGRGFLLQEGPPLSRFVLWKPFREPIRAALAGLDLRALADADEEPAPDRAGMAVAVLLGHLWRTRPKVTREGSIYKKQLEELERLFAPALGAGVVELLCVGFRHLRLLGLEFSDESRAATARLAPGDDPAIFFARPRAERARAFATAMVLPRWLEPAFSAGRSALPRDALRRAAHRAGSDVGGADAWVSYCLATGILRERPEGITASAELRGRPAPEPPSGGRWMVQPNLEVVLPPDAPPADAFRLACVAELASLDRAAVLRITPAALRQAAEGGLDAEEILRRLGARASAPVPELVARAVRDGARARPATAIHEGIVVVIPEEVRPSFRQASGSFAEEIAPGVFVADYDDEHRLRKALAGLGLKVWQRSTRHLSSPGTEVAAHQLEALLKTKELAPADPRLAQAVARARAGDPAEFSLPPWIDVREPRDTPRTPRLGSVDDLLDELVLRLERKERVCLERIPPAKREAFLGRLNRVLDGRLDPAGLGPEFAGALRSILTPGAVPSSPPAEPPRAPPPAAEDAAPPLNPAWEPFAEQAIAARRDLWIALGDERRPRLVTPHRIARRPDRTELLALAHDSGDLRAYPSERLAGAALAGASAEEHLPGAGPERPALRAARNDRCPCGSGRKYKACCLPADLARAGPPATGSG